MSSQGMTIAQAAGKLGVSSRTIRRYIKSGRIQARLVSGPFGQEYRIPDLPLDLGKARAAEQAPGQTPVQAFDIIKELQEKNLALAAQLGVATERVRHLENQVKLLAAPRQSWWRRLFSRQG